MLQTLDFEGLAAMGMGATYTFQVEAVDHEGVMPPGEATVTVRIKVRKTPGERRRSAAASPCVHVGVFAVVT